MSINPPGIKYKLIFNCLAAMIDLWLLWEAYESTIKLIGISELNCLLKKIKYSI